VTPIPRPLCLLAELTYRCPLKCPYCSNPLELRRYRDELDTATWQRVLSEAAALGVVQVHFSGGEPLVRRDLPDLVRHARQLDLYTHLSTGGTLADGPALERLRSAGLDAVQISLLDARPAENDWLAGLPSFDKKRQAVESARRLEFPVTLNGVLHRHNLDHLEEIIALACAWGVNRLELAHVQYTGWAFRNRGALLPTRAQVEKAATVVTAARSRLGETLEILHVLPDYFQQYPKACLHGWGRVFLTVAPDGAVLPCQTAREISGLEFPNVRDATLTDIWFTAPVFQRFRGTDWMPEPCRSCERRELDFGGCRCQAFLLTGDPGATDPVCQLSPLHSTVELALSEPSGDRASLQFRVLA
jgi:pyrroloquinoline quinone biosynthesis protein E